MFLAILCLYIVVCSSTTCSYLLCSSVFLSVLPIRFLSILWLRESFFYKLSHYVCFCTHVCSPTCLLFSILCLCISVSFLRTLFDLICACLLLYFLGALCMFLNSFTTCSYLFFLVYYCMFSHSVFQQVSSVPVSTCMRWTCLFCQFCVHLRRRGPPLPHKHAPRNLAYLGRAVSLDAPNIYAFETFITIECC